MYIVAITFSNWVHCSSFSNEFYSNGCTAVVSKEVLPISCTRLEYHLYDTADGKEAEDSIKPREPLLESYYQINQKSCNRRCAVTEQAESEL